MYRNLFFTICLRPFAHAYNIRMYRVAEAACKLTECTRPLGAVNKSVIIAEEKRYFYPYKQWLLQLNSVDGAELNEKVKEIQRDVINGLHSPLPCTYYWKQGLQVYHKIADLLLEFCK